MTEEPSPESLLASSAWRWFERDPVFARFALEAPDGVLVMDLRRPDTVFATAPLAARVDVSGLEPESRAQLAADAAQLVVRFVSDDHLVSATATRYAGVSTDRPDVRAWSLRLFEGSRPLAVSLDVQRLVESMPHFVWTCLPDGRCNYLSPQWLEYTGRPEAEQLGYGWLEQVHPDDRETTDRKWAEAAARSNVFDTEFRLRKHDGTYRWFKTRAVAIRDADGTLLRWIGSNTDVQELHEARENLEGRVAERTAALRVALEGLEAAQRVAHLGSWTLDVATGDVTWTDELFRILGREPGPAAPNYLVQQSFFTAESWSRLTTAIDRSVATGEPYELELAAVRPTGERRVAVARATTRKSEDGRVTHLVGTFHDITELAAARQQAYEAAERARLAIDAMGLGVWDYDIATGTLVWHERMYELYGVALDVAPSFELWQSKLRDEDREHAMRAVEDALAGRDVFDSEFRIAPSPGRVRTIHAVASVLRSAEGRPVRMVGLNRDVTTERALEEASTARFALVEQFVRETPAAIAMFDSELCVQITSRSFDTDFAVESPVGLPMEEIFAEPERWRAILGRALAGEVLRGQEEPFEVSRGRLEWLTWEARPWQGERHGVTLFTRIVSEQRLLRARVERAAEELRRSNQDLELFAYAASHDLQEPLRAVSGCAQMMQGLYAGKLDLQADELLVHMVDGAARMQALITGLLTYSRVSSRGRAAEHFPAREALDDALANLQVALDEGAANVSVGSLPIVAADRSQLVTVFQNLVSNALKYRRGERVRVSIDAADAGNEWVFSVQDDGIGIEPRFHRRIFELFQRLHTRSEYAGTGIGLALCAKIIARHGGRIWVESQVAEGSTFRFTLPKEPVADEGER